MSYIEQQRKALAYEAAIIQRFVTEVSSIPRSQLNAYAQAIANEFVELKYTATRQSALHHLRKRGLGDLATMLANYVNSNTNFINFHDQRNGWLK